jgi:hypothetical protein
MVDELGWEWINLVPSDQNAYKNKAKREGKIMQDYAYSAG